MTPIKSNRIESLYIDGDASLGIDRVDVLLVVLGVTRRQLECLVWVQQGKSASDIGGILGISGRTVEGHLAKLCERLDVKTRMQAVLKALDLGLLPSPHPQTYGSETRRFTARG